MLELTLRTTAILGVAWAIARLLPRATAATRHLVWHTAIVLVLAAPLVAPLTPSVRVPIVPRWIEGVSIRIANPPTPAAASDRTAEGSVIPSARERALVSPAAQAAGILRAVDPWPRVWLAGSAVTFFWFAIGWALTGRTTRGARLAPLAWQDEAAALGARLGIPGPIRLLITTRDTSPVATGLFHTAIILPESSAAWDADRRRAVLLHELAHIRRHDCRVQALAHVACALYWFNPLIWRASAALRRERERACDDEVLRHGAQPSAYASHLVEIARALRPSRKPTAALAMARPSELEGRVLSVLASRARVPARGTRWGVVIALAVATAAALSASPGATPEAAAGTTASVSSRPTSSIYSPYAGSATLAESFAAAEHLESARVALTSPDPQTRERAALALAGSGRDDSIGPLVVALSDPDSQVREKAALGLGLLSAKEVVGPLLEALRDPDSQVREKAALGLALRRDARIVEPLIAAMGDPDSQVREKVAIALGTSGDPRAVATLEQALDDPDPQVREKAVTSLTLLRTSAVTEVDSARTRDSVRGIIGAILNLTR